MILTAGLLVLAGLGLFVGGLATGTTSLYWGCVACCAVAAVLLVVVRLRPAGGSAPATMAASRTAAADETPGGRHSRHAVGADAPASEDAGTTPPVGTVGEPADEAAPTAASAPPAVPARRGAGPAHGGDPAEEDVEVTDLLMVVDMRDQVLVVDEHPRYHLTDCAWLRGRATIALPVSEARADGFTPCAVCRPDSHLADVQRARKAARRR